MTEPALLELLPPPGRLTLDLACGTFDGLDRALVEIARVLKPGGRLCVALDHPGGLEELSRAFEGAGFVLEAVREPPLRLVVRARREP